MADKTISDFTAATSLASADLFEIENAGGNSRKVTFATLLASLAPIRKLHGNVTQAATTTSTSEQDLMSYTLPANTLSADGMAVRVVASGTFAATTRSRTLKLYFGSNGGITFTTTTSTHVHWAIDGVFFRRGSANGMIRSHVRAGIAGSSDDGVSRSRTFTGYTEDLTAGMVIKVTGQVGGSPVASDITCEQMMVELIP